MVALARRMDALAGPLVRDLGRPSPVQWAQRTVSRPVPPTRRAWPVEPTPST